MRDIKFRGKRLDSGEWMYGYYLVNEFNNEHKIHCKGSMGMSTYIVDPESVGQYIGINSANYTNIFTGDIVKHNQTRFEIKWSDSLFRYVCIDPDNKTLSGLSNWRSLDWLENVKKHIKIVGNIHDKTEGE